MEKREINFINSKTSEIEIVYCKNSHISYPEHNHISIYTIGLVINGYIELIRKDGSAFYHTNNLFLVPPYEPHTIISGVNGYTLLSICINKKLLSEHNRKSAMLNLIEATDYLASQGIIDKEQLKLLLGMFHALFKRINNDQFSIDDAFASIREFLETNPEIEMKLENLSQISYTSKFHFIREFKKNVGLTPHQFQIQNRIRKAQNLLLQKHTITEVALVTGFYDQSHFIKCFKKIVGLTPSQYLQAYALLPD